MTWVGMNLPVGCENTRNTADAVVPRDFGLATACDIGSMKQVMEALPQGALTKRLIRYPSPYGRRCAGWHRPPVFSLKYRVYGSRRRSADRRYVGRGGFDGACDMALTDGDIQSRISGGDPTCTPSNAKLFRCSRHLPSWGLRPVATRCPNRRFWVAVPVRSPALWWAEVSSPAPLSGPQATWFIVRPTQAAVTKENSSRTPGQWPARCDAETRTIGAERAGGLFVQDPCAQTRGQEPERRDLRCSRRS